jgi:hypothetical protein
MSAPEQQDPEEEQYYSEYANPTNTAYTFAAKPLFCCDSFLHPTGAIQMPVCFMTKHNQDTSTAQETLMAEAIIFDENHPILKTAIYSRNNFSSEINREMSNPYCCYLVRNRRHQS